MNQLESQGISTSQELLQVEHQTFEALKNSLLGTDRGRYALIHGNEFAGCWDTEHDAVQLGYMKFGNVPFLVKQVLEQEPRIEIYSLDQVSITRGESA